MKIKAILGKKKVLENQGHDADLLVRLLSPALPLESQRPALAVVPVVDVSGSMQGAKLEAVKRALTRLIDHLCPGDRVGLVSFSDTARVVLPVTEVTEASRSRLRAAVRGLETEGSTNLAAGFLCACHATSDAALPPALRARLVLLTDGQANAGPATSRTQLRALVRDHLGSFGLSAFGYGDDCEHQLLADLAEEGRGSFAYIQNEDIVLTAFARELGGLVSTYAADVRVRIVPAAGAAIEERFGDLLYQAELSVCAPIALSQHAAATAVEVGRVEVTYRDTLGRLQVASAPVLADYVRAGEEDLTLNAEVQRAKDERSLRDAQEKAESHAQQGDYRAARGVILKVIACLAESPELAAFAREQLLPCYEGHQGYTAGSAMRAAAGVALKKRRLVANQQIISERLDARATPLEEAMTRSFERSVED